MSASAHHTRRNVIAGLAVAPLAGVAASLPAQAMTPEERVAHHVEGIRQAFREIHPDLKKFGEYVDIDKRATGGTGSIVMIATHLKVAS